jgi:ParB-like chromosome segregation protein Spo0J
MVIRVKVKDIPLSYQDQQYVSASTNRIDLIDSIRREGIKYPLQVYSLDKAKSPVNVFRGCGRICAANLLGIEEVDVEIIDNPTDKPYGTKEEQL